MLSVKYLGLPIWAYTGVTLFIIFLYSQEKQCNQMTQLQTCIVKALESCTKPTSANIVDSLFNFIRKGTPCKNFAKVSVLSRFYATTLTGVY